MVAWVVAGPVLLLGLLLLASFLEERVVFPQERASAINSVLARGSAADVEREVARLLKPVDRPRPPARVR